MEWFSKEIVYRPTVKKHLGLLLIGFTLGIFVYGFVNFNLLQRTREMYMSGLLGVLILYLTIFTNDFLNRSISFKRLPGLRILIGVLWNTSLAMVLAYLGLRIDSWVTGYIIEPEIVNDLLIKLAVLLFCISLLYNIIYFALYAYDNYVEGQLIKLKLERKQAELQLTTLKSQLSPHFLFNSINTLSALFQKDITKAELFIRSLARSYQYTLDTYRLSLVTVTEELTFVKSYLYLIKTRFGDGYQVHINLGEAALKSKIPPLTLQLLIENAIKHNKFDHKNPLVITLEDVSNYMVISNTKLKKEQQISSTKVGLKNITARYRLLTTKPVKVIDEELFTVKIPLIL